VHCTIISAKVIVYIHTNVFAARHALRESVDQASHKDGKANRVSHVRCPTTKLVRTYHINDADSDF
jgi:hypothetical protein